MQKISLSFISLFFLNLATSNEAISHVVMQEMQARAGYQEVVTLIVPHGCKLEPTTAIRLKIPEQISIARPEPKAGWTMQIIYRDSGSTSSSDSSEVQQEIDEVIWAGGLLNISELGRFSVLVRMPEEVGERLFFKTIQICGDLEESYVDTISNDEEIFRIWLEERPSPFVELIKPDRPQLGITVEELRKLQ